MGKAELAQLVIEHPALSCIHDCRGKRHFKESLPWLLIECKEQDVSLTDKTIQQILSYQTVLQSGYLIISNGNESRGFEVKKGEILEITKLPSYVG